MEELTPVGITISGGNITGIGGTLGVIDNTVPRSDGTGGYTAQGSDIVIDDATTATQNNIAIKNQHDGQTNSAIVITPKGTGAFIAGQKPDGTATGGGNARGSGAVDLQLERTAATQVASGAYSVAIGQRNTAAGGCAIGISNTVNEPEFLSGVAIGGSNSVSAGGGVAIGRSNTSSTAYGSVAIGRSNTSSGGSSVAIGNTSTASGSQSVALGTASASATGAFAVGSATASATYATAITGLSLANRYGMLASSAGRFAADGDAQRASFVLRCKTTTNTGVEMALDGATTYLGIPSGKVISCIINITGVKSDGSAVAHYVRQYSVKNVGGTSSQVYAPVTIGTDNASGTTIALSANNADDTLRILVTGVLNETWRWVATVDAVEVAYGV